MATADDLDRVVLAQSAAIDDVVGQFGKEFDRIIAIAKARTLARGLRPAGAKDRADLALIRRLDKTWRAEMDKAGAPDAIESVVSAFGGQFQFFDETLKILGLDPVKWTARDRDAFAQVQQGSIDMIDSLIDQAGVQAKRRALFNIGALPLPDLAEILASEYDRTLPQAVTLADTSMSTFYRQIQLTGLDKIEKTQGTALLFRYFGPKDKLTRDFCRKLLGRDAPLTRAQIDKLDNGQLPNVFVTGGGYNCRHQWVVAESPAVAAKPKLEPKPKKVLPEPDHLPDGSPEQQARWVVKDGAAFREKLQKLPEVSAALAQVRAVETKIKRLGQLTDDDLAKEKRLNTERLTGKLSAEDAKWLLAIQRKSLRLTSAKIELGNERRNLAKLFVRKLNDAIGNPSGSIHITDGADEGTPAWKSGLTWFESILGSVMDAEFGVAFRAHRGRAHYGARAVNMDRDDAARVAVHELGHWLEDTRPDIGRLGIAFRDMRTAGEETRRLSELIPGSRYDDTEIARKDKFLNAYMGKIYSHPRHSEIISMGFDVMFENPGALLDEDPQYFDFILGIIRQARRRVKR